MADEADAAGGLPHFAHVTATDELVTRPRRRWATTDGVATLVTASSALTLAGDMSRRPVAPPRGDRPRDPHCPAHRSTTRRATTPALLVSDGAASFDSHATSQLTSWSIRRKDTTASMRPRDGLCFGRNSLASLMLVDFYFYPSSRPPTFRDWHLPVQPGSIDVGALNRPGLDERASKLCARQGEVTSD